MIKILSTKYSNSKSVHAALESKSFSSSLISIKSLRKLNKDDLLIIPGVGHINKLSSTIESEIKASDLRDLILEFEIPVIGICLGFQYLCLSSTEDEKASTLRLIDVDCVQVYEDRRPSVGWFPITKCDSKGKKKAIESKEQDFMYFTHSYGVKLTDNTEYLGRCDSYTKYSTIEKNYIVSSIHAGHVLGMQFHPEKSGLNGIKYLCNWINMLRLQYN